jgi:hypothetical protein
MASLIAEWDAGWKAAAFMSEEGSGTLPGLAVLAHII